MNCVVQVAGSFAVTDATSSAAAAGKGVPTAALANTRALISRAGQESGCYLSDLLRNPHTTFTKAINFMKMSLIPNKGTRSKAEELRAVTAPFRALLSVLGTAQEFHAGQQSQGRNETVPELTSRSLLSR